MPRTKAYLTKKKFAELIPGNKVKIAHMVYPGIVDQLPINDRIDIRFEVGPWKGRTLNLVRQQIVRAY